MTVSPIFDKLVTGAQVEDAVIATLKRWLPTYLQELERQLGRDPDTIPTPRTWSRTSRFAPTRDDQIPAAIVVSPGFTEAPTRNGDGTYDAWWRIGVAIVAGGATPDGANELAKVYGAAVRGILVQADPSLGGFAAGLRYVDEGYDDVPTNYLKVGAAAEVDVDVLVEGIVNALNGPSDPIELPDEPTDWPRVDTVNIDIEQRSLVT